jgi:outer membrane protein W
MNQVAFFIIIFLSSSVVFGQNLQNRVSVGPRMGMNSSTFSMNQGETGPIITPLAGLFLMYSKHANWGINADFLYSVKGSQIRQSNVQGNGDVDVTAYLSYLHLPLQGVYFIRTGKENFRPKIGLGPYVSYLLNSTEEIEIPEIERVNDYANLDFGITGTLGFNFLVSRRIWFNADLRYEHGIMNIKTTSGIGRNPDNNIFNRNLSLSLGFGINLGHIVQ